MKCKIITLLLLFFYTLLTQSQFVNFKEKFILPDNVKETSGLLFLNDKIITHNDSGDSANLYEIDSLSGKLLRTVNVINATNTDWEDISEDEDYIYISDIGNNNGNRTDLKIYKVLKSDFLNNNSVSADVISFFYEDQTDFTSKPNNNSFDAEAIVVYQKSILIFTKNWNNLTTNVYKIPTTIGNHSATFISRANVEGLITGATYNKNDDSFLLCGYNKELSPFLIQVNENRKPGDDIFFSGFLKFDLKNKLEQGSQVEAITHINAGNYYISREFFSTSISGIHFTFPQKLYTFTDEAEPLLAAKKNSIEYFKVSPNPTSNKIYITGKKNISKISIYTIIGKKILQFNSNKKIIDITHFTKGVYLLKIEFEGQKSDLKKIIKL